MPDGSDTADQEIANGTVTLAPLGGPRGVGAAGTAAGSAATARMMTICKDVSTSRGRGFIVTSPFRESWKWGVCARDELGGPLECLCASRACVAQRGDWHNECHLGYFKNTNMNGIAVGKRSRWRP